MQSCTSAAPTVSEMPTGRMRGGRDRRPNITCRSTIAYHLGSTNPCPSADYMEPFSTLVFKFLVWIFATTTKICSRGHFNWIHTQILFATSTTAYSLMHRIYINGKLWSIGRSLQRHPFSRLIHSAGELLSGFRLPWPPSCCQVNQHLSGIDHFSDSGRTDILLLKSSPESASLRTLTQTGH
jgi:hypothetical protein